MSNIKYILTIWYNLDLASTSQGPHALQSFKQFSLVNSFLKKKKSVVWMYSQNLIPLTYVDLVHVSSQKIQAVLLCILGFVFFLMLCVNTKFNSQLCLSCFTFLFVEKSKTMLSNIIHIKWNCYPSYWLTWWHDTKHKTLLTEQ